MDFTAIVIRFMADWLIFIMAIISSVFLLRLPHRNKKRVFVEAVVVLAIGFVLARLLSLFYQGDRPYIELGVAPGAWSASNPGFPSEHAMVAMSLVLIVWVTTRNRALCVLLLGLGFAVLLGRVAALVHTPVDVVVGALCACVGALAVYRDRLFKTH